MAVDGTTWLARGPASSAVAICDGIAVSRNRLLGDIASVRAALARHDGRRWLLCTHSTYACAVGLFALWRQRATAVLPPSTEPGTLAELSAGCAGLVTDGVSAIAGLARVAIVASGPDATDHDVSDSDAPLEPDAPWLELCTSGSTGKRKSVSKTLRQLFAEVATLEQAFGREIGRADVLGTVSHQHIYGLLFRVLWPLASGRVFIDESAVDPGRLSAQLARSRGAVLVSSPAHLARLPELIDLATLRGRCPAVFSSGGPLERRTALLYHAALGHAPVEVLGSTETGGIAWRRRAPRADSEIWSAFDGVRIEPRDGVLHVASPATREETVATGDQIELLSAGRFRLLGRADRVVKLFEERVSLADVEARLADHPFVRAAAAVVVERGGATRMAVALELLPAGHTALGAHGRTAFLARLHAHLAPFFPPTVLPRAWRIVDQLPADAQGKRSVEALRALFEPGPRPIASPDVAARVVSEPVRGALEWIVELEVPDDLWCLRGHFDGFPIVPGVVQLLWVVAWARDWLGGERALREVLALKFKQFLVPGERFRLRLECDRDGVAGGVVAFRLANDRAEFSSGRIVLA